MATFIHVIAGVCKFFNELLIRCTQTIVRIETFFKRQEKFRTAPPTKFIADSGIRRWSNTRSTDRTRGTLPTRTIDGLVVQVMIEITIGGRFPLGTFATGLFGVG